MRKPNEWERQVRRESERERLEKAMQIRPSFTEAQAKDIRVAIVGTIEGRVQDDLTPEPTVLKRALGELDRALEEGPTKS